MNNSSLYARLALRQQSINHAAGIRGVTQPVLTLLQLYVKERQETLATVLSAAFLRGQIDGYKQEIAALTQKAQLTNDIQQQRQYLAVVLGLQRKAQDAVRQLQQIEWNQKTTQNGVANLANDDQQQREPDGRRAGAQEDEDKGNQDNN